MEINERDIQLKVPFSALTRLMEHLQPEDMLQLRQWLDEKLAEYQDELMLANPRIMAEILHPGRQRPHRRRSAGRMGWRASRGTAGLRDMAVEAHREKNE